MSIQKIGSLDFLIPTKNWKLITKICKVQHHSKNNVESFKLRTKI